MAVASSSFLDAPRYQKMNSELKNMNAGFRKLLRRDRKQAKATNTRPSSTANNKHSSEPAAARDEAACSASKICWGTKNLKMSRSGGREDVSNANDQARSASRTKKPKQRSKMHGGSVMSFCNMMTVMKSQPDTSDGEPTCTRIVYSATETEDATNRVRSPSSLMSTHLHATTVCSPQSWLDSMLCKRGYSTQCFSSLQTSYYNYKPTELQLASFDEHLLELVQQGRVDDFCAIMESGVSLQPVTCSSTGDHEHLVHAICRLTGAAHAPDCLRILLELGSCLQVCDKQGRTPLFSVCAAAQGASTFELVKLILEQDRHQLHMRDSQGNLPLEIIPSCDWPSWLEFLEACKDDIWPDVPDNCSSKQGTPPHLKLGPNARPVPNPPHAVTPRLAALLASGIMEPDEVGPLIHSCEGARHSLRESDRLRWSSSTFRISSDNSFVIIDGEQQQQNVSTASLGFGDDLRDTLDRLEPITSRIKPLDVKPPSSTESTIAEKKKRDALLSIQHYNPDRW